VLALLAAAAGCGDDTPRYAPEESAPVVAPTVDGPVDGSSDPAPEASTGGGPALPTPTGAGCVTATAIRSAVEAAALVGEPTRLRVTQGPLCVGQVVAVVLDAGAGDPLQVLLRRDGGGLRVTAAGSAICPDPDVAAAPAAIRSALGC
jgi:hypothetical protein